MPDKPSYLGLLTPSPSPRRTRTSISRVDRGDPEPRGARGAAAPSRHARASTAWLRQAHQRARLRGARARTTPTARSGGDRGSRLLRPGEDEGARSTRLDTGDKPDIFDGFFKDHSIDIRTGELLGRYIAEERDTARLLRGCYEQLKKAAGGRAERRGFGDDRLAVARGEDRHAVPRGRRAAPDRVRGVDAHGGDLGLRSPAGGGRFEDQRVIRCPRCRSSTRARSPRRSSCSVSCPPLRSSWRDRGGGGDRRTGSR